jgi:hypothetical protein
MSGDQTKATNNDFVPAAHAATLSAAVLLWRALKTNNNHSKTVQEMPEPCGFLVS